jgi:hypothetical protein
MFFKGSRYENVETDRITNAQGQVVRFKRVRFIFPDTFARLALIVNQGERLDRIAQRIYQDPELFWRICDANLALLPDDLVAEPGRVIKIPPSEA